MASQAFLNGLRAQAGMGTGGFTRPAAQRSADQNMANSGNPGLVNNMTAPTKPMPWQQSVLQNQQNAALLASDPTNIRYTIPQQQQNMAAYQGSQAQMQAINGAQQIPNSGGFAGMNPNWMQQMYGQQFTQPQPSQPGQVAQMPVQPTNGFTRPLGAGGQPFVGGGNYRPFMRPMVR